VNESDQPIFDMFEAYKAAVFAKDVDALVAHYDQRVCVFDLWGSWSFDGIDAWRVVVSDWFGALGTRRVIVEVEGIQTFMAQGLAVAHAFVTYKGVSAEGTDLRSMRNRLTWTLKQRDHAWKIVHEHTSAPVDHATSMAILGIAKEEFPTT
jgi:ketosteroid isomerase-like protein